MLSRFLAMLVPVRRANGHMIGASWHIYNPRRYDRTNYLAVEEIHDAQDENHFAGTRLSYAADIHDNKHHRRRR